MEDKIDIWGIFHDGDIIEIQGSLPCISLKIEIHYLMEMISPSYSSVWANLDKCSIFQFLDWESGNVLKDIPDIMRKELEIQQVKRIDNAACIMCTIGEITLAYDSISFSLESGENITSKELVKACNDYWRVK